MPTGAGDRRDRRGLCRRRPAASGRFRGRGRRDSAGGISAGGISAGGISAGGISAGGISAGGASAGGVSAGGASAGGASAGGISTGGGQPLHVATPSTSRPALKGHSCSLQRAGAE
jgi:hypothetical protein